MARIGISENPKVLKRQCAQRLEEVLERSGLLTLVRDSKAKINEVKSYPGRISSDQKPIPYFKRSLQQVQDPKEKHYSSIKGEPLILEIVGLVNP